jgi:hypothetical protein
MKLHFTALLALSLLQPAASLDAKPPANPPAAQDVKALRQAADALINQAASPPGQPGNASPSQGAAHAAQRAIQVVCSKDTPAADRAAICRANSPF